MLEAQKLDSRTMQASSVRPEPPIHATCFPIIRANAEGPQTSLRPRETAITYRMWATLRNTFPGARCVQKLSINWFGRSAWSCPDALGSVWACGANPAFTSQDCRRCRHRQKIPIGKPYICAACGLELNRDVNAALNILRLGQGLPLDEGNAVARLQRLQKPPALAVRQITVALCNAAHLTTRSLSASST